MSIPGDHVARLVQAHYGVVDGQLVAGGLPVAEITQRFGTPLYVYVPDVFRQKLARLRTALPGFEISYAIKANPNPAVMRALLAEGCGLSAATRGELTAALHCGCPPSRVTLAGAGKLAEDIRAALEAGVRDIHIDSPAELDCVAELAAGHPDPVRVTLRVNPQEVQGESGGSGVGGKPAAYGFDEEDLPASIDRVLHRPWLQLAGVHAYFGTQLLSSAVLVAIYQHILRLARKFAAGAGGVVQNVDFGGGFGVPYFPTEAELALEEFGQRVRPLIAEARRWEGLQTARLAIEPGRYLVAEGGVYVTRVVACKSSRGKRFVIVDGGLHHHLAASGNLGHVIKRNFPVAVANRMAAEAREVVDVVGRQCTPLDTLARDVLLPAAQPGDLVVFFQSGAYGRTTSPLGFRSHPPAREILATHGTCEDVTPRGEDAATAGAVRPVTGISPIPCH